MTTGITCQYLCQHQVVSPWVLANTMTLATKLADGLMTFGITRQYLCCRSSEHASQPWNETGRSGTKPVDIRHRPMLFKVQVSDEAGNVIGEPGVRSVRSQ